MNVVAPPAISVRTVEFDSEMRKKRLSIALAAYISLSAGSFYICRNVTSAVASTQASPTKRGIASRLHKSIGFVRVSKAHMSVTAATGESVPPAAAAMATKAPKSMAGTPIAQPTAPRKSRTDFESPPFPSR